MSKAAAMPLPRRSSSGIYPLSGSARSGGGGCLVEKAPYLALSAATALLAVIAQSSAEALTAIRSMGSGARIGMTATTSLFYPWKLVWSADLRRSTNCPGVDPLAWGFCSDSGVRWR